ncbi:MAG: TetR/AcrR family transcriptional regulator [Lachnospiraceae bacterium]|nr:TetR/AcrR family transcriptional regulator [Lachnospiraceae bacterium]
MIGTEERILDAALEVVQERTISGTRMHHIAEKADVVQSNVHYYYKTKKDLLKALQEKVLRHCLDIRKKERESIDDSFEAQMEVFIKQKRFFILEDQKYDYAELDFWMQGRIEDNIKEDFQKSFRIWRGEIREVISRFFPELDKEKLEYFPYMIVSLLEGASIQYLIDPEAFDLEKYFEYCRYTIDSILKR